MATSKIISNQQMQSGIISGTAFGTIPANSYKDYSLTFPKPFATTPTVVACLNTVSTGPGVGRLSVSTMNQSPTSVTIRIYNADTSDRGPGVSWVAF